MKMGKNDFCHGGHYVPPAEKIDWGMLPCGFGHQRTVSRNYFFNGMKRGNHEMVFWQYTISGYGMVEFEGKNFPVRQGEAFLLTVPEKHLYFLPEESDHWEFLFLTLQGCEAVRIARQLQQIFSPVSANFASAESVALAWELMQKGMEKVFSSPRDASILTYRFMMSLTAGNQNSIAAGENIMLKIHHFCLKHLSENISVDDLAEFAGFSRSHFCRIFREQSGKAPHEYLLELRIRMAMQMLQNGSSSVKEISSLCGFEEPGYFCKVFRRFAGTTPGVFRRKNGGT